MTSFSIQDLATGPFLNPGANVANPFSGPDDAKTLDAAARYVAQNFEDRPDLVDAFPTYSQDKSSIWDAIGKCWDALLPKLDPKDPIYAEVARPIAFSLAKLERNLVAGIHEYQLKCLPHAPVIRKLIFDVTTFARIEDPEWFNLQATLAQLLSNLVSPVDDDDDGAKELADSQLSIYLSGGRENDVIIRLLDSRDMRTNMATLHLLANLTQDSTRLSSLLCPTGIRWLSQILGRMDDWAENADDGRFDVAACIFNRLIAANLTAALFTALSAPDEPVSPSQTALLKLVDAYLASPPSPRANPPPPSPFAFLLPAWRAVAAYATASMDSGKDDPHLAPAAAALMLTTECLAAIALAAQERSDEEAFGGPMAVPGGDEAVVAAMKGRSGAAGDAATVQDTDGKGIVPQLVAVLGAGHAFLPRIKPGAFSLDPSSTATAFPPTQTPADADAAALPFSNLKRDLVRLLGVLAYNDPELGDVVREAGGVPLVLAMTDTDERNAYLREYALLAVRNLMAGNKGNQDILREMDPVGVVGESGEVLPLPEKVKAKLEEERRAKEEAKKREAAEEAERKRPPPPATIAEIE